MAIQKKVDTWKLKKWFSVYAGKPFNDFMIGEIPANEDKAIIGRQIKIGLNNITKNPQQSYMNLYFKITSVNGDKAEANLVKMEILFSYIRTLVRKYKSVSLSVVNGKSSDNAGITIKPIIVTQRRDTRSKMAGIRKEAEEMLSSYIKSNDKDAIINSIIEGKLQQELFAKLKHITDLSKVEIKRLDIS